MRWCVDDKMQGAFVEWDVTGNTKGRSLVDLRVIPDQKAQVLLLGCADVHHVLCTAAANSPMATAKTGGSGEERQLEFHLHDSSLPQLARATLFLFMASGSAGKRRKKKKEADVSSLWAYLYHAFLTKDEASTLRTQLRLLIDDLQTGSGSRLVVPMPATRQALVALLEQWEVDCEPHLPPTVRVCGLVQDACKRCTYSDDGQRVPTAPPPVKDVITGADSHEYTYRAAVEKQVHALVARAFSSSVGPIPASTTDVFLHELFTFLWHGLSGVETPPMSVDPETHVMNPSLFVFHQGSADAEGGEGLGMSWGMRFDSSPFPAYFPLDKEYLPEHCLRGSTPLQRACMSTFRDLVAGYRRWQLGRQLGVLLWSGEPLDLCLYTLWPRQAEDEALLLGGKGGGAASDVGSSTPQGKVQGPPAGEEREIDHELTGGVECSFDAIDTAHLVDSLGLLNLLACCGPLLKEQVSSRLWTVSAKWQAVEPTYGEYLRASLGCDVRLLPSLLGLRLCSDLEFGTTSPRLFAGHPPSEQFTVWGPAILDPLASHSVPGGSTGRAERASWGFSWSSTSAGGEEGRSSRESMTPLTLVPRPPSGSTCEDSSGIEASTSAEITPCGIVEALESWHGACFDHDIQQEDNQRGVTSATPLTFLLLLTRCPPGVQEAVLSQGDELLGEDVAEACQVFQLGCRALLRLLPANVGCEMFPWSWQVLPGTQCVPAVLYSGKPGPHWEPEMLYSKPTALEPDQLRVFLAVVHDEQELEQMTSDDTDEAVDAVMATFERISETMQAFLWPADEPAAEERMVVHTLDSFRFTPDDASLTFALPADHGLPAEHTLVVLASADGQKPVGWPTPLSEFKSMPMGGTTFHQDLPAGRGAGKPSFPGAGAASAQGFNSSSGMENNVGDELAVAQPVLAGPEGLSAPPGTARSEGEGPGPLSAGLPPTALRVSCLSEYVDCYRGTVGFAPGAQGEVELRQVQSELDSSAAWGTPAWCADVVLGREKVTLRLAWPVLLSDATLRVARERGAIAFTLPKAPFWPPAGGKLLDLDALPRWPIYSRTNPLGNVHDYLRLQYTVKEVAVLKERETQNAHRGLIDDVRLFGKRFMNAFYNDKRDKLALRVRGETEAGLLMHVRALKQAPGGALCVPLLFCEMEAPRGPMISENAAGDSECTLIVEAPRTLPPGTLVLNCTAGALAALRRLLMWNACLVEPLRGEGAGPSSSGYTCSFVSLAFPATQSCVLPVRPEEAVKEVPSGAGEVANGESRSETCGVGADRGPNTSARAGAAPASVSSNGRSTEEGEGSQPSLGRAGGETAARAEGLKGGKAEVKKAREKVEETDEGVHPNGSPAATPKVCVSCGATGDSVRRCSRCKGRGYCSKACQKLDWPQHKPHCRPPAAGS
eukprot:jgi/Mesen1/3446/ME000194S02593